MSGMMTNPPPNDSPPTLNASQATDASTPPLTAQTSAGAAAPQAGEHPTPPAGEQHEPQPRAEGRGGREPGGEVREPANVGAAVAPAWPEQGPAGLNGARGAGGARARAGAEDPQRRGACHEQHREREDDDQAGQDEPGA